MSAGIYELPEELQDFRATIRQLVDVGAHRTLRLGSVPTISSAMSL